MKRDAYNDEGPAQKRHRSQPDDEVTFLIPSKVAGSIIGKGGANISKLRNQYKASITVPDCPGPERVLSIAAEDIETVLDIVKDILPNLSDVPKGNINSEDLDIRLLIHQSRAGCVIGKAGAKIKELREKTGARLKIFSSPAPQSSERVVQLVGKDEAVVAGVREVLDLVRQVPIKGPIQNYDPHNYDDFYAEEYGGYGGFGPRGGPPQSGPRGRGPPPPRGGPPMGRNGPPPGPRGPFESGFSGGMGAFPRSPRPRSPPFPPAAFRAPLPARDNTTQVTIPKDLAGAIIGKAGTRIRKIRADSGAGIDIAEPLPGSSDRVITITGSPSRIQMAQFLLQRSVQKSNPNLGVGGGRGGNY